MKCDSCHPNMSNVMVNGVRHLITPTVLSYDKLPHNTTLTY